MAMADRADLLDRINLALSRSGVNGVLGTPDFLEDLLLLGALHGKVERSPENTVPLPTMASSVCVDSADPTLALAQVETPIAQRIEALTVSALATRPEWARPLNRDLCILRITIGRFVVMIALVLP